MSQTLPSPQPSLDIIELHFEDCEGRVRVVLPDKHVMVMPVNAAAAACRAFHDQYIFAQQFELLLSRLAEWCREHHKQLSSAYLTVRDAGLLFVAVRNQRTYDEEFESNLTDLDLEVANDSDFSLVRFDVLGLPQASEESVRSFLAAANTFRYKMDG